ncbi:YeeE/YedE family protein, partial [archaeon]
MSFHLSDNIALENGALGGVILAVSSASLMYLTGKVTGISGISSGLILKGGEDWQAVYIAGLVTAGILLHHFNPSVFGSPAPISTDQFVLGAFLVGLGTKLSSGCTSGHGLVGLARLSPRSLLSVLTFMGMGALTAS